MARASKSALPKSSSGAVVLFPLCLQPPPRLRRHPSYVTGIGKRTLYALAALIDVRVAPANFGRSAARGLGGAGGTSKVESAGSPGSQTEEAIWRRRDSCSSNSSCKARSRGRSLNSRQSGVGQTNGSGDRDLGVGVLPRRPGGTGLHGHSDSPYSFGHAVASAGSARIGVRRLSCCGVRLRGVRYSRPG